MRKPLLIAGLLSLAASPSLAQDWRPLAFAGEGTEHFSLVYLNVASVTKTSETGRRMTIATVFVKKPTLGPGRDYDWLEVTYQLDCAKSTARPILTKVQRPLQTMATSNTVGNDVAFRAYPSFSLATAAACTGDYSNIVQRAQGLVGHANQRFEHREALIASAKSRNWARTGLSAQPGNRIAVFVDRDSVIVPETEFGNRRHATMMIVTDKSGKIGRTLSRLNVDCNASTRRVMLSDSYDGGAVTHALPDDTPAPLSANALTATAIGPICSADYARARLYPLPPEEIPPTAHVR